MTDLDEITVMTIPLYCDGDSKPFQANALGLKIIYNAGMSFRALLGLVALLGVGVMAVLFINVVVIVLSLTQVMLLAFLTLLLGIGATLFGIVACFISRYVWGGSTIVLHIKKEPNINSRSYGLINTSTPNHFKAVPWSYESEKNSRIKITIADPVLFELPSSEIVMLPAHTIPNSYTLPYLIISYRSLYIK